MAIINLDAVEYITLYTGNNGPEFCLCNCPCCSQLGRGERYQGTIQQVMVMFDKLPNLKQLYLMGNPDVTVDQDFCNEVMKEAVKRNIHVCFSTSGLGGKKVLSILLKDIPSSMVDYISFSFDGTRKEEMSLLKGIDYPMEEALEGLEWCIENGYIVKVQPTLWSSNYNNTEEIIDFYVRKGVKWFTFHIGSLESGIILPTHQHLSPKQIMKVYEQISDSVYKYSDIKVRCPIIYTECGENDPQKWYCMHPERVTELLIFFTEDGIKATHAPIVSIWEKDLIFDIEKLENIDVRAIQENEICPISEKLSGRADTICRFVCKYWNY